MKKNILIFLFFLLVSCVSIAQKQDTIPVRSLVEKGSQGDILFGNKNKKARFPAAPQMLNAVDASPKKDIHSRKKKTNHKKI
jgi:hypothetical protein